MDKKIVKKKWTIKRVTTLATLLILSTFFIVKFVFANHASTIQLDSDKLVISTVKYDDFQEYIPVIGIVKHKEVRYLDAIQPGVIKKVHKESGSIVKSGEVILELSNANLELQVMNQESSTYYQLSNVRNAKLQLNQNNLNQMSQLVNYNYQLSLARPMYEKYKILLEKKLISKLEFDKVAEQYHMFEKQKEIFLSTYKSDSISRVEQLKQISRSEARMEESLVNIRSMLDELIIKSPIDGQLSTKEFKVGETISIGQRIGQVDVKGSYVISVNVNEHYLPNVALGQKGTFEFAGKSYELIINKIFPTVTNNNFQVNMLFTGSAPINIKNGQNLQVKLELGSLNKTLIIPAGSFFNKTSGQWIFVLDNNNKQAVKRKIKLGRKNPSYYEVLEGLKPNEKVITSSYDTFSDFERIQVN